MPSANALYAADPHVTSPTLTQVVLRGWVGSRLQSGAMAAEKAERHRTASGMIRPGT
jgi:hypothetical protein